MLKPEVVSSLLSALVGALVAAAIFFGQREQSRWQATIAIVAEFNSPQWLAIRSGAYEALCSCDDPSLAMTRDLTGASLSMDKQDKVWAILAFYARLYLMIRSNFLVKRRILPAFGEVFFWWWEFHFAHVEKATHTSELKLAKRLHAWFEAAAAKSNDSDLIATWRQEGRASRAALLPVATGERPREPTILRLDDRLVGD